MVFESWFGEELERLLWVVDLSWRTERPCGGLNGLGTDSVELEMCFVLRAVFGPLRDRFRALLSSRKRDQSCQDYRRRLRPPTDPRLPLTGCDGLDGLDGLDRECKESSDGFGAGEVGDDLLLESDEASKGRLRLIVASRH